MRFYDNFFFHWFLPFKRKCPVRMSSKWELFYIYKHKTGKRKIIYDTELCATLVFLPVSFSEYIQFVRSPIFGWHSLAVHKTSVDVCRSSSAGEIKAFEKQYNVNRYRSRFFNKGRIVVDQFYELARRKSEKSTHDSLCESHFTTFLRCWFASFCFFFSLSVRLCRHYFVQ